MMRFFISILLFITSFTGYAQLNKEIDSLKILLVRDKTEGTLRLERLVAIPWRYRFMDSLEQARTAAQSVIELSDKILATSPGETIRIEALSSKASANMEMAETYKEGNEQYGYYQKALQLFAMAKDTGGICSVLTNQEGFCEGIEAFDQAEKIGKQRLRLTEAIKDTTQIIGSLTELGYILSAEKKYDEELIYLRQCLRYQPRKKGFSFGRDINIRLAELFSAIKKCDSAFYYGRLVVEDSLPGHEYRYALRKQALAGIYLTCSDTLTAIACLNFSLQFFENVDLNTGSANACTNLASIYFKLGQMDKAMNFCNRALKHLHQLDGKTSEVAKFGDLTLSQTVDMESYLVVVYRLMADIYNAEKDYKQALTYERLNRVLTDTITSREDRTKNLHSQQQFELNQEIDEQNKKEADADRELQRQKYIRYATSGGLVLVMLFLAITFFQMLKVRKEKKRGDVLLLNILPSEVAEELKEKGTADAKLFDDVTVLFTDFADFTKVSERLSPQQLVDELHACFSAFDDIITKYHIEKIKTVGDAYLAVSGLPMGNLNHAVDVVNAAIEIRDFMANRKKKHEPKVLPFGEDLGGAETFGVRIGVHSGSVVAGIVGVKKFAYDIWGDTVNTAARMEQNSEAGKINISEVSYQLVKDKFACVYRGEIEAKNKGKLKMYFVERPII